MAQCSNCGCMYEDDSNYCPYCGQLIRKEKYTDAGLAAMEPDKQAELANRISNLQKELDEIKAELNMYRNMEAAVGQQAPVNAQAPADHKVSSMQQMTGNYQVPSMQQMTGNYQASSMQQMTGNYQVPSMQKMPGNYRVPSNQTDSSKQQHEHIRHIEPVKNFKINEAGIGKVAMGIGAILLILISFALFAVSILPQLSNTAKAVLLTLFSTGMLSAGTALHKRSGWWKIPECIGLVGLYLSIIISRITLEVIPMSAVYPLLAAWIILTGIYAYKRELIYGIIEQVGLFCSNILLLYNINNYSHAADKCTEAYPFLFIILLIESILLILALLKKKFVDAIPVYITELLIIIVSIYVIGVWTSAEENYIRFALVLVAIFGIRQYIYRPFVNKCMKNPNDTIFMLYYTGISSVCQLFCVLSNPEEYDVIKISAAVAVFMINTVIISLYKCKYIADNAMNSVEHSENIDNTLNTVNTLNSRDTEERYHANPVRHVDIVHYHIVQALTLFIAASFISIILIDDIDRNSINYESCLTIFYIGLFCILALFSCIKKIRINEYYPMFYGLVFSAFCADKRYMTYVVVSVCFMLVISGMAVYRYIKDKSDRTNIYYIMAHVSVCMSIVLVMFRNMDYITDKSILEITVLIGCIFIVALNFIETRFRYFSKSEFRYMISSLSSFIFFIFGSGIDGVLFWVFSFAVIMVQLTLNTREIYQLEKEKGRLYGLIICVKYSIFVYYLLCNGEATGIVYSIVFILAAGVSVAAGMFFKTKSLRIYGLALSLVSIVKLIMFDIYYDSLVMRAFSFLLAGLICLAISYAYSRFEKSFDK